MPIHYNSISLQSQLPKHMDMFWPSKGNKDLLEKLLFDYIRSETSHISAYPTILGEVTDSCDEWKAVKLFKGTEYTRTTEVKLKRS